MIDDSISLVIPCYNSVININKCLDSVLAQRKQNLEIIIIDDASNDCTYDIITSYSKLDSRIITYRNSENKGAGYCRNIGLEKAKGNYIQFLDSDDTLCADIYGQIDSILSNDIDWIKFKAHVLGRCSEYIRQRFALKQVEKKYFGTVLDRSDLLKISRYMSYVVWNGIYRKDFLHINKVTFPELYCVNDRMFTAQVYYNTNKFMLSDLFVTEYAIDTPKSLTAIRKEKFYCEIDSLQKSIDYFVNKSDVGFSAMLIENEIIDYIYYVNLLFDIDERHLYIKILQEIISKIDKRSNNRIEVFFVENNYVNLFKMERTDKEIIRSVFGLE